MSNLLTDDPCNDKLKPMRVVKTLRRRDSTLTLRKLISEQSESFTIIDQLRLRSEDSGVYLGTFGVSEEAANWIQDVERQLKMIKSVYCVDKRIFTWDELQNHVVATVFVIEKRQFELMKTISELRVYRPKHQYRVINDCIPMQSRFSGTSSLIRKVDPFTAYLRLIGFIAPNETFVAPEVTKI